MGPRSRPSSLEATLSDAHEVRSIPVPLNAARSVRRGAGARRGVQAATLAMLAVAVSTTLGAWGAQGHRLVGLVAANHLSLVAKRNVEWLLAPESLADVSSWADEVKEDVNQTAAWHYVNIPPKAPGYDRDRDCPRQPGVAAGARGDAWRDCVVDRIQYNEARLANAMLDRADRAIAMKFLVHFVGDLHQPFHASGVERGGNGILVTVFGAETCGGDPARPVRCNLHSVWDTQLIAHRGLDDRRYAAVLEQLIASRILASRPVGQPADWAMESLALSNTAMLAQGADAGDTYYRAQLPVIDERLALAGVRLAALINRSLTTNPPK